jgi:hypothetical protein
MGTFILFSDYAILETLRINIFRLAAGNTIVTIGYFMTCNCLRF